MYYCRFTVKQLLVIQAAEEITPNSKILMVFVISANVINQNYSIIIKHLFHWSTIATLMPEGLDVVNEKLSINHSK